MTTRNTPRGNTQKAIHLNNRHAEKSLLSISSAFTTQGGDPEQRLFQDDLYFKKQGGDPRLRPSGMTPSWTTTRGFTLIELLVVVLIIGLLAAVALPQYNKAVKKAQGREVLVALNALDKAFADYYLEHGTYEGITEDALSVHIPDLQHFQYGASFALGASHQFNIAKASLGNNPDQDVYISIQSPDASGVTSWTWTRGIRNHINSSSPVSWCDYFDGVIKKVGTSTACYIEW